jgi:hypothetical protein
MRFQLIMLEVNHLASASLLLALAACMVFRRLRSYAPIFFAYVVFSFSSTAVLYGLLHFGNPYWFWYGTWFNAGASLLLEFIIVAEIFNRLFAPYEGIRRFAKIVLLWALSVLTIIGALTALLYHEVQYSVPIFAIFWVLERSLRAMQLGLILVLFALSKYLHLRWKNLSFGITLGFGLYAVIDLAGNLARAYYGKLIGGSVYALEGASYWITVIIWIFYVLQPDVVRISNISLTSPELERWDRALSQLLKRSASSSLAAPGS